MRSTRRKLKPTLLLRRSLVFIFSFFVLLTLCLAYWATRKLTESDGGPSVAFEPVSRVGWEALVSPNISALAAKQSKEKILDVQGNPKEKEKQIPDAGMKRQVGDLSKERDDLMNKVGMMGRKDGHIKQAKEPKEKRLSKREKKETLNPSTQSNVTHDLQQAKANHEARFSTYPYELGAMVLFRVDTPDGSLNLSTADLKQWMAYMSYAGVDHFYAYDNCREEDECQTWLAELAELEPGLVTYIRWPVEWWESDAVGRRKNKKYSELHWTKKYELYKDAQLSAILSHLKKNDTRARFEIICDIDEYPFMPLDTERDFLLRFAQNMDEDQTLLSSMIFAGNPDTNHTWRTLRYIHRAKKVFPVGRTKYIYRTAMVDPNNQNEMWVIHWLGMLPWSKTQVDRDDARHPSVQKLKADPSVLRLNHYWCERGKSPDFYSVLDDSIRLVVDQVLKDQGLLKRLNFGQ